MTKEHYEMGQEEYEDQQEAIQRELEAEREREASLVLDPDVFLSDWE